jgi:hypothetical protein
MDDEYLIKEKRINKIDKSRFYSMNINWKYIK